jgi:copper chaperone CopZ
MSTAIIVAVLLGVCILSVKSYAKRLSHGCCGGGDSDAPKKVKVADKNKKDYPYCVTVEVDGMTCNHCKARVENALNSCNGVWAEVNLRKKIAVVRMKERLSNDELKNIITAEGYTVGKITM